ncbi:MAG: phage portal protein [Planctomycetota bacterium]
MKQNSATIDATVAALANLAEGRSVVADGQRSITEAQLRQHGLLGGGAKTGYKLTSPYEQIAVFYGCIEAITNAIVSMPLMISTSDDRIVESGDIIDLLNNPYPGLSCEDLIENTASLPLLTGSANLIKNDGERGRIQSLRPVGGNYCLPWYDDDGEVDFYRYTKPGSRRGPRDLATDRVIRWTRPNYLSGRFTDGLSVMRPLSLALQQVYGADVANLSNLNNGIVPSLHVKFPQRPSDDQIDDYRRHVRERNQSPERAGEPLITYDGVEIEGFEKNFRDMLHDRLRMMSIMEICVACGVPPAVLNIVGEGGLGHGKETEEANAIFWQMTILPIAHTIARRITTDILPEFGTQSFRQLTRGTCSMSRSQTRCVTYRRARRHARGFRIMTRSGGKRRLTPTPLFAWFDTSRVMAMIKAQLDLLEKLKIMVEWLEVPPGELIEAYDLPVQVHDHQMQATRAIGRSPVDQGDPLGPEALGEKDEPVVADELEEDLESDDAQDRSASGEYARIDQRSLEGVWRLWLSSWAGLRNQAEGRISRYWRKRNAEVLANAKAAFSRGSRSIAQADGRRDVVAEILFSINPSEKDGSLVAAVRGTFQAAAQLGGDQSMDEAASAKGAANPDPYRIESGRAADLIRQREVRITSIEQAVRRRLAQDADAALRDALAEGMSQEQTLAKLQDTIRKRFKLEGNKAAAVARTEVGAAVEEHRQLGREEAGVPLKSWLSSRKETSRVNHLQTERATMQRPIPNNEPFTLAGSGERGMQPRSTDFSAGEVVNCACTTIARFPNDTIRSAVGRYAKRGFLAPGGKRSGGLTDKNTKPEQH